MIEIIFLLAGLISLFASFFLYTTLLEKGKIKPHIPARYMCSTNVQRGNFYDAETKKFYKWDELMKIKKERKQNET